LIKKNSCRGIACYAREQKNNFKKGIARYAPTTKQHYLGKQPLGNNLKNQHCDGT